MTEIKYRDFDQLKASEIKAVIKYNLPFNSCQFWKYLESRSIVIYGLIGHKTVKYGDLVKAGLVQK